MAKISNADGMPVTPNLYTVPLEKSFLDVLARHVLDTYGPEPERLAPVVILLPNRRSCRSLQECFLRAHEGAALILPRIKPIGDVEEDELFLFATGEDDALASSIAAIPPVIGNMRRLMLLARMIWDLEETKTRPLTASQCYNLAGELARFIDETIREQISADRLAALVPEEYAEHWQVTLSFLSRLLKLWPDILAKEGRIEAETRRNLMLQALAKHWQRRPPAYPVIAAGSTGSIPATARLLKIVSRLPAGKVVLPGLDLAASNDAWEQLAPSHPQFALKQLLTAMEARRSDVRWLDHEKVKGANTERAQLVHEIARPAAVTDQWRHSALNVGKAAEGLSVHHCRTVFQEAKIIALRLREILETPGKTAALVTQDRSLATQVSSQMQRFGIAIDDSAGQTLARLPEGAFFLLTAEAVQSQFTPSSLLALLKHPFAALGMEPEECRQAARTLEISALRGLRPARGIQGIRDVLATKPDVPNQASQLLDTLEDATAAFSQLIQSASPVSLQALLTAHIETCEMLADSAQENGGDRLWKSEAGQELKKTIEQALDASPAWPVIEGFSYIDLMTQMLLPHRIWHAYGRHPRLHILSPLEARLQAYDCVILGSMNEESWPQAVTADPWMSRPMRERFGLPSPERQTGQAAHDFTMLCASPEVMLTRSERIAGAPSVPSRWLTRLNSLMQAHLDTPGIAELLNDERWQDWAAQLDDVLPYNPLLPPAPCPPLSARPRVLSVTAVETLMRDPYSIYARHILKLKKLEPTDKEPDMADFGKLFHAALEDFAARFPRELPTEIEAELLKSGRHAFQSLTAFPSVRNYWMPRYARICRWLAQQEIIRRLEISHIHSEEKGSWTWMAPAGAFTLRGRIDRIEIKRDGSVGVIDYKTGTPPPVRDIWEGYASQLPLSAALIETGGVPGIEGMKVTALEYWRLGGVEEAGQIMPLGSGKSKIDVRSVIEAAISGVQGLIAAFDNPAQPYQAVPVAQKKPRYSDYSHLARLAEWANES